MKNFTLVILSILMITVSFATITLTINYIHPSKPLITKSTRTTPSKCVLNNIDKARFEEALTFIIKTCKNQSYYSTIPTAVLENIKFKKFTLDQDKFFVKIYNNSSWYITEIKIRIIAKDGIEYIPRIYKVAIKSIDKKIEGDSRFSYLFKHNYIPPLGKGEFTQKINMPDDNVNLTNKRFKWEIVNIKGYDSNASSY